MRTRGTRVTMGATLAAVAALLRTSAGDGRQPSRGATPAVPVALDHVILGIDSLERGVALLRAATGVSPVYGGAHPGRGTQNALLSLGDGRYLELLAPNPADTAAASSADARDLARHRTPTPIGWAFHVGDADSARAAFVAAGLEATAVRPGARDRPDGRRLSWRTVVPFGTSLGKAHEVLPFAIAWGPGTPHPSSDAPAGCTLERFAIVSPVADSIGALLARAGAPTQVEAGAREHVRIALRCPKGRITLP